RSANAAPVAASSRDGEEAAVRRQRRLVRCRTADGHAACARLRRTISAGADYGDGTVRANCGSEVARRGDGDASRRAAADTPPVPVSVILPSELSVTFAKEMPAAVPLPLVVPPLPVMFT